ncbi:MAG TPA: MFS transporter [Bryobacteraceae bacterium]|nr:MFS transporter [Bryobacteraceae bacterium]
MKLKRTGPALAVLFLVNVLNYYDRQALGAVAEPLRREFALSDAQIGALSTFFILVYAVAGLPLGRLADTWSRRKLMALGVSVWAALTALGGAAVSYAMLAATRLGVGIGEAVCAPAANSWIASIVPAGRRARAMAGFMMAVPVGVMLSSAVTGPAAQAWGWRAALALAAVPAILLVPALLWLNEPPREAAKDATHAASPLSLLRIPALGWIAASGAILNFALYSFSTFLPAFLKRYHGLSVAQAGLWTGIGSGVAGVAGAVLAGVWGDRIIVRWANGRLLLAAGAALVAAPLAWMAIAVPAGQPAPALALIMPAYGLLQTYYGLVYAAINDIVVPELRGTAMAGYLLVTYVGGAAFGPLLTGMLSDRLAQRAAGASGVGEVARAIGLHQAMYLIPAMALALAAVLGAGARASRGVRT